MWDDVPRVMAAADGYVMSSAWEGMPMVLLEAAAAGLPIVATEVGGNREVVIEGQSESLVPPRDDAALAAAMERLGAPPARAPPDGQRGGRTFAGTTRRPCGRRWEELYREVLARKGLAVGVASPA